VPIQDVRLLERLHAFVAPIFARLSFPFCGIDVILDRDDRLCQIVLNGSPSFEYYHPGQRRRGRGWTFYRAC
jgi:hypothetical protein